MQPSSIEVQSGPAPRQNRGSGYFEFAVVVIVIAIASLFLIQALGRTARDAETAMLQVTTVELQAALMIQRLRWVNASEPDAEVVLVGANPASWFDLPAERYLGELAAPPSFQIGFWYFDLKSRQLVYMCRDGSEHAYAIVRRSPDQGRVGQVVLQSGPRRRPAEN